MKVLSDLAMISAGETAMEVDKVSCFLSAVMGFAPFIFDLQENSDLRSMLDSFQKVVERCDHSKLTEQWVSCLRIATCFVFDSKNFTLN